MKEPVFKKEYSYINRRFLNSGEFHTTGSIIGKLAWDQYYLDSNLFISDCSRTISLQMDCDSLEDIENSLFKLDQIIEVCQGFKESLVNLRPYIEEKREYEKWEEEQSKNKKKDE